MSRRRGPLLLLLLVVLLLFTGFNIRESTKISTLQTTSQDVTPTTPATENSTLGFQHIFAVEVEYRQDRWTALELQANILGLNIEPMMGVLVSDLEEHKMSGLPPSSGKLLPGERASIQAHANIWRRMVRENIQTALIVEGDSLFDAGIKPALTRAADALEILSNANPLKHPEARRSPVDPYNHHRWDVFYVGHCNEGILRYNEKVVYPDDTVGAYGLKFSEDKFSGQRMVRRSGDPVCTCGYALSLEGAKKMLLNAMVDHPVPVDVMMLELSHEDRVAAYTVYPTLIDSWIYKPGIGMEAQNSVIHEEGEGELPLVTDESPEEAGQLSEEQRTALWKQIHAKMNVWEQRHCTPKFKKSALELAYEKIFEEESVREHGKPIDVVAEVKSDGKLRILRNGN